MLLNLSNHPSTKWSDTQCQVAIEQYSEIMDLAFPQIPPAVDTDGVRQLVEEYEVRIRKLAAESSGLTVHFMGELTFTHLLVNRLLAVGIPCVASTSERTVIEEANGRKVSKFNFVRFRNYSEK